MAEVTQPQPLVRIRGNGNWWETVIEGADGNAIPNVSEVVYRLKAGQAPTVTLTLFDPDVDLVGTTDVFTCRLCGEERSREELGLQVDAGEACAGCCGAVYARWGRHPRRVRTAME